MSVDGSDILWDITGNSSSELEKQLEQQEREEEEAKLKKAMTNFLLKNAYLADLSKDAFAGVSGVLEVDAKHFYFDLFMGGVRFESSDCVADGTSGKGNAIATVIKGVNASEDEEFPKNYMLHSDLAGVKEVQGKDFAVIPPLSFFGKRKTKRNAHELFALAIDLDGVNLLKLKNLVSQMANGILLPATYIVNSGYGVHLYYVLSEPIALYNFRHSILNQLKEKITDKVWNEDTSVLTKKQYQGIIQSYRAVGSFSKFGKGYLIRAFKFGDKVTVQALADWVDP